MPEVTTSPPPSLIFKLTSILDRVDVGELFPKPQPLEVELGAGDGSFLARYAQRHPERNFFGVERLLGRLRKIDRKGRRAGLDNLRVTRIEASYFLEFLLPGGTVSALHVYFPDPWPKRKHRRHRLINERFTELARTILTENGLIYLRTDDVDYFSQMTASFATNQNFLPVATPEELAEVVTDFEKTFNARGIPTNRAAYRKLG